MTIELANRLIEFRKKHNMSQEELASKLNLSRQTISKWERSEASPDTDNLIELAKLYNISIDDLLNTTKDIDETVKAAKAKSEETKEENKSSTENSSSDYTSKDGSNNKGVHFDFANGFHIESDNDEVHIGKDGIHVQSGSDGDEVHIDKNGIHIKEGGKTTFSADGHTCCHKKDNEKFELVSGIVSSILSVGIIAAYIAIGCTIANGWYAYWPITLLICVVPSIFLAVKTRRFCSVAYPIIITVVYLLLGLLYGWWGTPYWIMFLSIPAYYIIFGPIDKLINEFRKDKFKQEYMNGDKKIFDFSNDNEEEDH